MLAHHMQSRVTNVRSFLQRLAETTCYFQNGKFRTKGKEQVPLVTIPPPASLREPTALTAMDGTANVKSIMAKFGNNLVDEIHNRQAKVARQPSSTTKAAFDKFSQLENAGPPAKPSSFTKPASLKPPLGAKPSLQDTSDKDPKPPPLKSNLVASKVAALAQASNREAKESSGAPRLPGPKPTEEPKQDSKPVFPKPFENRLPGSIPPRNELKPPGFRPGFTLQAQENEAKPVFPKGVRENFSIPSQENESKPPFPKPPLRQKPSPQGVQHEEVSNKNAFSNRVPPGPTNLVKKANSFRSTKDTEEKSDHGMDSTPSPFSPLKHVGPPSNRTQILQKSFTQRSEEVTPSVPKTFHKLSQEIFESNSGAPSAKFPSLARVTTIGLGPSNSEKEEKDKKGPKRKVMPPLFKLGPPPQKPNRPPVVDLEKYRKANGESPNKPPPADVPPPLPPSFPATTAATSPPPPPPPLLPPPVPPGSHPSTQAPVLPPRNIKPRPPEDDENYDDADSGGTRKSDEHASSDGEMYEDIQDMRSTGKEDERRKEKEEKKKSDQEKKEHKEKEKKEQEVRKKFKLTGPIEVIHQARACTDYKGGKNDLSFKQGDQIEIIRLTDNPEGKWLGRTRGSYGYIKTTMVEIDYDSLRRKPRPPMNVQPRQQDSDQEVYDDVGDQDSISSGGQLTTGVGFPPPPSSDEIYDGVDDEDNLPKRGSSAKQMRKESGDSDVYDDVEPTDFPPPPKELSLGINSKSLGFGRAKSEERDSQKHKKMEKEEKEFRKKFKYEGDIQVLYTTTVTRAPCPKKRGSKDLPVKPGEAVDVIKNVDENKILCRNEEGKYGYVRRSCIADEDDEIYDDIADGCIYDND
uniref:FYN-binding protein 1 isoform X2 n=1 Tax=Pogona vitticeps TaxID=103695 RepID=A0A6J0TS12_9SAUR